jgi:hypothetical protein
MPTVSDQTAQGLLAALSQLATEAFPPAGLTTTAEFAGTVPAKSRICSFRVVLSVVPPKSYTLEEERGGPLGKFFRSQAGEDNPQDSLPGLTAAPVNGRRPVPPGAWPSPEALMRLYNEGTPDQHPKVKHLTARRRDKAQAALRQFPQREFWERAMAAIGASHFLQHGSERTPHFRGDFDWLLACGPDRVENVVKLVEGKYADDRPEPSEPYGLKLE